MKATKKPVTIDYLSYKDNISEVVNWVSEFGDKFSNHFIISPISAELCVKTLEGTSYPITTNHMIIRGIKGEYYPCERSIFLETYTIQE